MADIPSLPRSPTLQPPRKSVELEDPGAHDLGSDNEEDVFADAEEGQKTLSEALSRPHSPVPITRVEKVDDGDSYGDVPGTPAYKMRAQDAVPDELEVIPEGGNRRASMSSQDQATTPGGNPIPRTVVETVDPTTPGHGDVLGAAAHTKRKADAVPDVVLPASKPGQSSMSQSLSTGNSDQIPVPKTVVTKVDGEPSHGEVPGTEAHEIRKADAEPDAVEEKGDPPDLPTSSLSRSTISAPKRRKQSLGGSPIAADGGFGPMDYEESDESDDETTNGTHDTKDEEAEEAEEGFGDDFDDFEAGAEGEDFGEFDDGFGEPEQPQVKPEQPVEPDTSSLSPFPLLDFSSLDTLDDLLAATSDYLDVIFPSTTSPSPPPPPLPPSNPNPIFLTPRSTSLYTQLSAPPPLQPPNWLRSRIRRLFLVSLGVPVDLDEILPASKQKKLILPSTTGFRSDSPRSTVERLKRDGSTTTNNNNNNRSRTSLDSTTGARTSSPSNAKTSSSRHPRRRGPAPPPELDLPAITILSSTTDAALDGMDDAELQEHARRLEEATLRASEVLEYWLKRRDEGVREKEAFEGVIENLVRHVRRVRG